MTAVPPDAPLRQHDVARFVAELRTAGLDLTTDAAVAFADSLSLVDRDEPDQVYWASRSCLVRRNDDIGLHDAVFDRFFFGVEAMVLPPLSIDRRVEIGFDELDASDDDHGDDDPTPPREPDQSIRFSAVESLRQRDFADCTPAELAELATAIEHLRPRIERRVARRRRPGRHDRIVDIRRSIAAAIRTEGEVLRFRHRHRTDRPRRVVVLVDISGSMEPYARMLVRFGHAVAQATQRAEVFALGTRVTRITRELERRHPDVALDAAAARIEDWSGGTRLGEGLREFIDRWGQRGVARGAIVVILSDGWDRGDPAELEAAMARLARIAHRVIWVNPLRASPGYAPLARGMAAALPYCDEFVDGHSFASLDALVELLAGTDASSRKVTNR